MWTRFSRNRIFLVSLTAITMAALAGVAKTYHAQVFPTIHPFSVTYKVLSSGSAQDEPKLQAYRVLAARSDGTVMMANSLPDGNGHIHTSRALQLKDRYVVVDPLTESVSTYEPYKPLIVATQDCGGKADSPILGYSIEKTSQTVTSKSGQSMTVERWLAIDLDCIPLREYSISTSKLDQMVNVEEAISVTPGEPPMEYFDITPGYQERGPAAVDREYSTRHPGGRVFSNQRTIDDLEKNYEKDRQKLIKEGKISPP